MKSDTIEARITIPKKTIVKQLVAAEARSYHNMLHTQLSEANRAIRQLQERVTAMEVKVNRLDASKKRKS